MEKTVIFAENDWCVFKLQKYYPTSLYGFLMETHIENRSGKCLLFEIDAIKVNGYAVKSYAAVSLGKDERKCADILIPKAEIERYSIDKVKTIEFVFNVMDCGEITSERAESLRCRVDF